MKPTSMKTMLMLAVAFVIGGVIVGSFIYWKASLLSAISGSPLLKPKEGAARRNVFLALTIKRVLPCSAIDTLKNL